MKSNRFVMTVSALIIAGVVSAGAAIGLIVFSGINPMEYDITYSLDGGVNNPDNGGSYIHGDRVELFDPVKDGCVFAGWYEDPRFNEKKEWIDPSEFRSIHLFAKWIPNIVGYTVKYQVSGHIGSVSIEGEAFIDYSSYDTEEGFAVTIMEKVGTTIAPGTTNVYEERSFVIDTEDLGSTVTLGGKTCIFDITRSTMLWKLPTSEGTDKVYKGGMTYNAISTVETQTVGSDGIVKRIVRTQNGNGTDNEIVLTMSERSYTERDFSVKVYGGTGVSVSCDTGDGVILDAVTANGTFSGWYDANGRQISKSASCYIGPLTSDAEYYAYGGDRTDISSASGTSVELKAPSGITVESWSVTDIDTGETIPSSDTFNIPYGGTFAACYKGTSEENTVYGFCVIVASGKVDRTLSWDEGEYTVTIPIEYGDLKNARGSYVTRYIGGDLHNKAFVTTDAPCVIEIANYIMSKSADPVERSNILLKFVQEIEYVTDPDSMRYNEYWKYPIETLFDMNGDCEDTSILFCAIASAMGLDSALLIYDSHMAAGVALDTFDVPGAYYYEIGGKKYYFCETTGKGWNIGMNPDPEEYNSASYCLIHHRDV